MNLERSSTPLCSIVVVTHNRSRMVPHALRSALQQTVQDIEVIVVDDGSSDDTAIDHLVRSDSRIRSIEQPNQGLAAARNSGIRASRGRFIVFLDDDDLLIDTAVERLLSGIQRADAACVGLAQLFVTREGVESDDPFGTGGSMLRGPCPPVPPATGFMKLSELLLRPLAPIHAGLFRAEALRTIGGFDRSRSAAEDYDLWLRLVRLEPVRVLHELVALVRIHPQQMSSKLGQQSRETRRVLETFLQNHPEALSAVDSSLLRRRVATLWEEETYAAFLDREPRSVIAGKAWSGLKHCHRAPKLWLYLWFSVSPSFYRCLRRLVKGQTSRERAEPTDTHSPFDRLNQINERPSKGSSKR